MKNIVLFVALVSAVLIGCDVSGPGPGPGSCPVVCRDGTCSGCSSVHSGCCSSHGGVALTESDAGNGDMSR